MFSRKLNEKRIDLTKLELLDAEILVIEEKYKLATSKFETLKDDPVAPQWVSLGKEKILNEKIP